MGRRILVPKGDQREPHRPALEIYASSLSLAAERSTHDIATSEAYELHRILHGVPEGITDILPVHSFPMECNLDLMGARTS